MSSRLPPSTSVSDEGEDAVNLPTLSSPPVWTTRILSPLFSFIHRSLDVLIGRVGEMANAESGATPYTTRRPGIALSISAPTYPPSTAPARPEKSTVPAQCGEHDAPAPPAKARPKMPAPRAAPSQTAS